VWQVLEDITVGYTEGITHSWMAGIRIVDGGAHTSEDSFRIGSILFSNFINSTAGVDPVYAMNVTTDYMAYATYAGPICFHGGDATGGSAYADMANPADYDADYLIRGHGWPVFVDVPGGKYDLVRGSVLADKGCGARTGGQSPGIVKGETSRWIREQNGLETEWAVLRLPSKAY
jgi:hypothetical protein